MKFRLHDRSGHVGSIRLRSAITSISLRAFAIHAAALSWAELRNIKCHFVYTLFQINSVKLARPLGRSEVFGWWQWSCGGIFSGRRRVTLLHLHEPRCAFEFIWNRVHSTECQKQCKFRAYAGNTTYRYLQSTPVVLNLRLGTDHVCKFFTVTDHD